MEPSTNGQHGRLSNGRFGKGNQAARGHRNPHARATAALRTALLKSITPEALERVAAGLLGKAEAGDVSAAKLLLTYTIGRPVEAADPDRLDHHEALIERTTPSEADRIRRQLKEYDDLDQAEAQARERLGRGWRKWIPEAADDPE